MSRILFGKTTAATLSITGLFHLNDYSRSDWNAVIPRGGNIFKSDDNDIDTSDGDILEGDIEVEGNHCSKTSSVVPYQYNDIIKHLANQPDLMNSFLPENLQPADREIAMKKIWFKVRRVLADTDLMAEISAPDNSLNLRHACDTPQNDGCCWDDLVNDHKCMICSDLLAGPVILGCSHSFCGMCLQDMRDSWESDDSDIRYSCPTCREEIENEIFERNLDDIIAQKVSLVPDCEPKRDWAKRREAYKKQRRNRTLEEELKRGGGNDSNSDEEFYIAAAAMVVIALILAAVLARSRAAG